MRSSLQGDNEIYRCIAATASEKQLNKGTFVLYSEAVIVPFRLMTVTEGLVVVLLSLLDSQLSNSIDLKG